MKLAPPALPLTDALQQPRPPPLGLPASVTTVTPASSTQPSARRASIRAERALATPREMERTFWMLDTNRSGAIDRKELRKALAALGFDADLPATRAALAQYDKDLGRTIDLSEFTKLVRGLVYAIDAENAPPPPPPPLDEPPPQLLCAALEGPARLATEDGAHAELCERDVIGVLVARLLTPSAVDERVAARELRLLAAVSSHPEGSAAATRAAHLLENHGAVDAMLARLPRMPMVLLPLAFSTLADWCATPALLVELLNWRRAPTQRTMLGPHHPAAAAAAATAIATTEAEGLVTMNTEPAVAVTAVGCSGCCAYGKHGRSRCWRCTSPMFTSSSRCRAAA